MLKLKSSLKSLNWRFESDSRPSLATRVHTSVKNHDRDCSSLCSPVGIIIPLVMWHACCVTVWNTQCQTVMVNQPLWYSIVWSYLLIPVVNEVSIMHWVQVQTKVGNLTPRNDSSVSCSTGDALVWCQKQFLIGCRGHVVAVQPPSHPTTQHRGYLCNYKCSLLCH